MKTLYVKTRREWRAWLRKNSTRLEEIWLVYYKKNSQEPRIAYDAAVEEALCFGWIDSITKRIDEARYAQKFSPRRPQSRWSASNIRRAKRLIADGKMTAPGLKAFDGHSVRKIPPLPTQLPRNLELQFEKQTAAWENFHQFPPFYRRMTIGWVASAKKDETKLKRLNQLIQFSARNERIQYM
jgi:uncharacterized protein YdeI (YjbR/CyaY-like superfamily)